MKRLKDQPESGDHVLDVGAFSLDRVELLVNLVGKDGFVHAVDPQFCIYEQAPSDANFAIWDFALGTRDGIVTLCLPGGIRPEGDGPFTELRIEELPGLRTEITTIDAIGKDWKRLDFLGIDVNGFEPLVLLGGNKTIMRLRPTIRLKIDPDKLAFYGFGPANIVSILAGLHYKVYPRPRKAAEDEPHELVCDPQ